MTRNGTMHKSVHFSFQKEKAINNVVVQQSHFLFTPFVLEIAFFSSFVFMHRFAFKQKCLYFS